MLREILPQEYWENRKCNENIKLLLLLVSDNFRCLLFWTIGSCLARGTWYPNLSPLKRLSYQRTNIPKLLFQMEFLLTFCFAPPAGHISAILYRGSSGRIRCGSDETHQFFRSSIQSVGMLSHLFRSSHSEPVAVEATRTWHFNLLPLFGSCCPRHDQQ